METILNKKTIKELSSVLEEITDCPVSFCQDGQVIVSAASGAVGTQIPEALSAQNENRAVEAANGLYLPVRMDEKIPIGAVGIIGETESLLHMKSLGKGHFTCLKGQSDSWQFRPQPSQRHGLLHAGPDYRKRDRC